jgi:hypothetical protein
MKLPAAGGLFATLLTPQYGNLLTRNGTGIVQFFMYAGVYAE